MGARINLLNRVLKNTLICNPWMDCLWMLAGSRSDKASYRNVIFLTSTIRTYVK